MLKQDENDFVLLNKAKDLYVYTSEAVGNDKVIPKHRRYTAGQRLETLAIDILSKCFLANTKDLKKNFDERQALQDEVIALCLVLENLINALKASDAYPGVHPHKASVWTKKSMDVRYLCAAWRDHELERHLAISITNI